MKEIKEIKTLNSDDIGKEFVFVGSVTRKETDKAYQFVFNDETGNLYFSIFKEGQPVKKELVEKLEKLKDGDLVKLTGVIHGIKKDKTSVNSLKSISDITRILFYNNQIFDISEMQSTINKAIKAIKDKELKTFAKKALMSVGLEQFTESPCSLRNYYACKNGLMCYTYKMLKSYSALSKNVGCGERDIILTTILVHRIGKALAYRFDKGEIVETESMKLFGDELITANCLIPLLEEIKDVSKKEYLEHVIFSTKKQRSWGALNEAKAKEAYFVHYLEKIVLTESEINNLEETYKDSPIITYGAYREKFLINNKKEG